MLSFSDHLIYTYNNLCVDDTWVGTEEKRNVVIYHKMLTSVESRFTNHPSI